MSIVINTKYNIMQIDIFYKWPTEVPATICCISSPIILIKNISLPAGQLLNVYGYRHYNYCVF